jgi:hypothetical protein
MQYLPPVLVSAARFGAGMSDDLRRDPVPAIADKMDALASQAFPPPDGDEVPLPPKRAEVYVPNVPIEEVCETLASAAEAHRLPVPFFIRLIWQESRFDPRAISPVGAQGVAQFMPATAAAMGLKNPFDPLEALHYSARLLRELMGQFGNLGLAAAAYNAGPKRILDWLAKKGKLPEETRNYVMSITGHAAEHWRFTKPGRLSLDVPKRAPCKEAAEFAHLIEVPAPPPVVKKPARAKLLAKGKGKEKGKEKATASRKKRPGEVSAARKGAKVRTSAKPSPLVKRATASRKQAKQHRTRSAAAGPLRIAR